MRKHWLWERWMIVINHWVCAEYLCSWALDVAWLEKTENQWLVEIRYFLIEKTNLESHHINTGINPETFSKGVKTQPKWSWNTKHYPGHSVYWWQLIFTKIPYLIVENGLSRLPRKQLSTQGWMYSLQVVEIGLNLLCIVIFNLVDSQMKHEPTFEPSLTIRNLYQSFLSCQLVLFNCLPLIDYKLLKWSCG